MAVVKAFWFLLAIAAVSGGAAPALADAPSDAPSIQRPQAVDAPEGSWSCNGASPARARWLADEAKRQGAYQRAAECYLVAGDPVQADRAFVKAFVEGNASASQKVAATVDDAKLQARRIREAFRGR
jgi:hypothetical protein